MLSCAGQRRFIALRTNGDDRVLRKAESVEHIPALIMLVARLGVFCFNDAFLGEPRQDLIYGRMRVGG